MRNFRLASLHKSLNRLLLHGLLLIAIFPVMSRGQQPLDLFPDDVPLDAGFIRIGAWNLRHINLEGQGVRNFLPGANDSEDFAILVATFAKAIRDLGLDVVAVVEHQPRANEPNRLLQILNQLNNGAAGPWRSDETTIDYDDPSSPFSNLQFGLLWNSTKVTIDPNADTLLTDLRQPRNQAGELTARSMRIPWLVPIQAGSLSFDLLVLHLKSGGDSPQQEEVDALQRFITQRQGAPSPRHLIICGDWNIRPDQSRGRNRLRQLLAPTSNGNLMRILTVEEIRPTLDEWESLGAIQGDGPLANLVPFSHYNAAPTLDTFLDHIAISRTLDEVFDHPIQVKLANGISDLRPGFRVAVPLISEENYSTLTDHLPIILTLRTSASAPIGGGPAPGLRIVAATPNPTTDDTQDEEVSLRNTGTQAVTLAGWKIGDSTGTDFWVLTAQDGVVQPGATMVVRRKGRPMALNNTGDSIVLVNPSGTTVDQKSYGNAPSGKVFTFN